MADAQKTRKFHNGAVERPIDFRKIMAIIKKNWLVLSGDNIRLVPLLMFPIIMIVLFGYASGNIPKHLATGIVDYDQTVLSRQMADQLSGIDVFAVKYHVGTQDEGKRLLDSGQIKVLLILPQGLEDKVLSGEPAQIELMVDESDSSVAQTAKGAAQTYVASASSQIMTSRLLGISASAAKAKAELLAAKAALGAMPSTAASQPTLQSAMVHYADASSNYKTGSSLAADTAQGLLNNLGFIIDQNEVADTNSPQPTINTASLALLATGDSQQSTLQQVALYQALGGLQGKLFADTSSIYSSAAQLGALVRAQEGTAEVGVRFIDSAAGSVEDAQSSAAKAQSPIELALLSPYGYGRKGIDYLLPAMLAMIIFQGATMGLGRAIAGERKDGSLTRVFLTPTSNITIIFGTQMFYLLLEIFRSSLIIAAAVALFGVTVTGNVFDIFIIIAIYAAGATGVGMVMSVVTHNQEQYMAVGMLVSMPIMFLSGVFFPIQTMPEILQGVAQVLPVTYAADALRGVMVKGFTLTQLVPDIAALFIFWLATLVAAILLFKRELV